MKFKEWLLISEAKKDINLSNPNLTTTIPPLNTSISNPKLTTTIPPLNASISNPKLTTTIPPLNANLSNPNLTTTIPQLNAGQKYKKTSSENFKDLAYYYGRKGAGPSVSNSNPDIAYLGRWLNGMKNKKINIHKKSDDETWAEIFALSKFSNWIDPLTKKPFIYKDLPKDFRDIKPNKQQEVEQENSIENFKKLAYYFGRNNTGPSRTNKNPDIVKLARFQYHKINKKINPHEESLDNKTWAELVKLSKTKNWIDPVTKKPFPYKNLPNDWRDVKSNVWQELLQKNQEKRSENFKELAYYYGRKGSAPSAYNSNPDIAYLGNWLAKKKTKLINPFKESDDKTWAELVKLSKTKNWIDPVTKKPFPYKNLPNDWYEVKPNAWQEHLQKNQEKSSENFKELAYYYGRKGSAPSGVDFNPDIKYLGKWYAKKKGGENPHEESDDITWAEIVASSKNWDKKKFPHDLPNDWRIIEPSDTKSLGEKYVANILEKLGIEYETQDTEAACFNKICLRFDFSIEHNGKKYFVEYNGRQHYIPAYFGSGEGMTKQEIAKDALKQFKYIKKNDTIKYNHIVKEKIPFLVIPYWLYKNKKQDIIKSTIKQFLKTNKFDKKFADPVIPPQYKEYHDRMLKMTKCFASGELDCKDLFKKQKTTFEQFLINKNFTYYNA